MRRPDAPRPRRSISPTPRTRGRRRRRPPCGCTPSWTRRSMRAIAVETPCRHRRAARDRRPDVNTDRWWSGSTCTSSTVAPVPKARRSRRRRSDPALRDVGHSLEHDPYPTRPVPADDRPTDRRAGARSCACSPSFAPTGRRSSSRRCSPSCRRSRGSSSSSSPGSSSTSSTPTRTRASSSSRSRPSSGWASSAARSSTGEGSSRADRRSVSSTTSVTISTRTSCGFRSGFYDRSQTGQLMSRATIDLQSVRFFLGYGLIFFAQHVVTIVAVTAVLFFSWQLALVAVAIAPVIPTRIGTAASPTRCSATCNSPSQTWPRSRRSRSRVSMSSSRSRRRTSLRSVRRGRGHRLRSHARSEPPARAVCP